MSTLSCSRIRPSSWWLETWGQGECFYTFLCQSQASLCRNTRGSQQAPVRLERHHFCIKHFVKVAARSIMIYGAMFGTREMALQDSAPYQVRSQNWSLRWPPYTILLPFNWHTFCTLENDQRLTAGTNNVKGTIVLSAHSHRSSAFATEIRALYPDAC